MARVHPSTKVNGLTHISKTKPAAIVERRIRRFGAWFLLYLIMQAELGLAWDRQWHDLIGRDSFWIPPHIMMYSGIGGAGLVALAVVLVDTLRYFQQAPGVDDRSTLTVLRFFHAPFGYVILGFGALIDLVAAPFDNWWHSLYGIDVTLWSPFHLMGTVGGLVEGLGLIFIFASEVAIERQQEHQPRHFLGLSGLEWGAVLVFSAYMEVILPTLTAFLPLPPDSPGPGSWHLLTYPLPLALLACFCLIGAVNFVRKSGTATLAALLLWLLALFTMAFVPWALRLFVTIYGLHYRFSDRVPVFNTTIALLPLLFLISALMLDGIVYWQRWHSDRPQAALRKVWLVGAIIALPTLIIPPSIVMFMLNFTSMRFLPGGVNLLEPDWLNTLLSLPLVLLAGVIAAFCGARLGEMWYGSKGN
jgi:hypothetical protein